MIFCLTKIVNKCAAFGCSSGYQTNCGKVSTFYFPHGKSDLEKSVNLFNGNDKFHTKNSVLLQTFENHKIKVTHTVYNSWISKRQSVNMHFNVERNKNNIVEKEISWRECYLHLADSVSGDIVANMNIYQLLIFMVRIESWRGERWLQPIYSGSVTFFWFILNCVIKETRQLFFLLQNFR